MKKPAYLLVIMDSAGGMTRRAQVPKDLVAVGMIGLLFLGVAFTAVVLHGVTLSGAFREAQVLQSENHELKATLRELNKRLPNARLSALRNNETFRQVWIRSGLGRSPNHLGVGPISDDPREELSPAPLPALPLPEDPRGLLSLLETTRHTSRALQNKMETTLEYFHDADRLLQNTPSIRPSPGSWVTSHFGRRRDPMHGGWVMHKGVDLAGYTGLPIHAPADGIVIWTGRRGGYGLTIVVDHGYGLQTHYAHLDRYSVNIGQKVRRGETIAEMGSTGKSTGPHLHYEVRRNGEPVNPINYILD